MKASSHKLLGALLAIGGLSMAPNSMGDPWAVEITVVNNSNDDYVVEYETGRQSCSDSMTGITRTTVEPGTPLVINTSEIDLCIRSYDGSVPDGAPFPQTGGWTEKSLDSTTAPDHKLTIDVGNLMSISSN